MEYPFESDGCSVVPDYDQTECCVRHDWLYWQGGSFQDRLNADRQFFECIQANTKLASWLAPIRWFGVRIGGVGFLPFRAFRWGYGWKWPRSSTPDNDTSEYTVENQREAFEKRLELARAQDRERREKKASK